MFRPGQVVKKHTQKKKKNLLRVCYLYSSLPRKVLTINGCSHSGYIFESNTNCHYSMKYWRNWWQKYCTIISGWMQIVILIYHITGASKSLNIYILIRVLVSAYLFLSGFGHLQYFWKQHLLKSPQILLNSGICSIFENCS